jgi:hypothetical protein
MMLAETRPNRTPNQMSELCGVEQNVGEPFRLVDHHVVTGIVLHEGLPSVVGFAFSKSPVQSSLRIYWSPN